MRVLIVQRSLSPPGGGNAVAAWMAHALYDVHEVGTLTAVPWPVAATNAFYGTSIPEHAITQHIAPAPWRWLAGLREDRLTRLRMASVYGHARTLVSRYDLMITAEYYAAFPKPGIQYVQFPARLRPTAQRLPPVVNAYFALCSWLLGAPWTDAARNTTLVNSRWTASRVEQLGELPSPIVLYPPVLDPGGGLPWGDRHDTFLVLGRFHESKRIEQAMSIVARLRARTLPRARLLIVGSVVNRGHAERLRAAAACHGGWIEFHEDLSRTELNRLMGQSRFGIHAMVDEHFGMATAEMTRAGCVVFAHRSGGSREVLNDEDSLLWSDEADAVEKISAVLAADPGPLRSRLLTHAAQFSPEAFIERFRSIVANSGQLSEARIGK